MNILKIALATAALTGFASSAMAQDGQAYGSLGVATYEFDTFGADAKLGYNFTENFGIEGQGILGLTSDKETVNGVELKGKIDYTIGAFAVARLPVSEQFDIFARGGYHQTGVSLTTNGVKVDGDVDGFAVGGGIQYNLSDVSGIRAEYTYLDGNDVGGGLDTVSVSFVRKF